MAEAFHSWCDKKTNLFTLKNAKGSLPRRGGGSWLSKGWRSNWLLLEQIPLEDSLLQQFRLSTAQKTFHQFVEKKKRWSVCNIIPISLKGYQQQQAAHNIPARCKRRCRSKAKHVRWSLMHEWEPLCHPQFKPGRARWNCLLLKGLDGPGGRARAIQSEDALALDSWPDPRTGPVLQFAALTGHGTWARE